LLGAAPIAALAPWSKLLPSPSAPAIGTSVADFLIGQYQHARWQLTHAGAVIATGTAEYDDGDRLCVRFTLPADLQTGTYGIQVVGGINTETF
jgi:hypothetical protein